MSPLDILIPILLGVSLFFNFFFVRELWRARQLHKAEQATLRAQHRGQGYAYKAWAFMYREETMKSNKGIARLRRKLDRQAIEAETNAIILGMGK